LLTELAEEPSLVILCGHYEGMDQRVLDAWDIQELSIGDYILTGGELPAMVLIDAVSRLLPGVLSSQESALEESIYSGLLEYPQYTRPREFEGREVPEVLLSGNHRNIELWRLEESLKLTAAVRPDLFDNYVKERCSLPKDEKKVMEKIFKDMAEKEADLKKIDTEDTEVMVHVMEMTNVLRDDKREQPFDRADLLKGAPQATEDSWQVPRLVK
jgi:tRNA (guanine37-N1)-methyltransferase